MTVRIPGEKNPYGQRMMRLVELKAGHAVPREPRAQALVEIFRIDEELGIEGCRKVARAHAEASFDGEAVLECDEDTLPAEPVLGPPEGPPRADSLGTRRRLRTDGARFLPDPAREAIESISFER